VSTSDHLAVWQDVRDRVAWREVVPHPDPDDPWCLGRGGPPGTGIREERPGTVRAARRDRAPVRLILAEATDHEIPVTARAARSYLDVAFFHPYDDGNARLAGLVPPD
jgi:hypothetical protein